MSISDRVDPASVRPSVTATNNQILSEASLGLKTVCLQFWDRSDQNFMATYTCSSRSVIMDEMVSPLFLDLLDSFDPLNTFTSREHS